MSVSDKRLVDDAHDESLLVFQDSLLAVPELLPTVHKGNLKPAVDVGSNSRTMAQHMMQRCGLFCSLDTCFIQSESCKTQSVSKPHASLLSRRSSGRKCACTRRGGDDLQGHVQPDFQGRVYSSCLHPIIFTLAGRVSQREWSRYVCQRFLLELHLLGLAVTIYQ